MRLVIELELSKESAELARALRDFADHIERKTLKAGQVMKIQNKARKEIGRAEVRP